MSNPRGDQRQLDRGKQAGRGPKGKGSTKARRQERARRQQARAMSGAGGEEVTPQPAPSGEERPRPPRPPRPPKARS